MNPGQVRRALHTVHAFISVLLIATGLLLWNADLRARLLGGYGREVLDAHLWLGWGLIAVPLLSGLIAGRPLARDLMRRLGPPGPLFTWVKLHTIASLVMAFLLAGSGLVLWADIEISLAALDFATTVHLTLTWLLAASIPVHVVVARRKVVSRTREILGLVPDSEFGTAMFDEDDD